MVCKKCGATLLDTDLFCVRCGTKVEKENRCAHCGEVLRADAAFCPKCGKPVNEDPKESVLEDHEPEDDEIPVTKQVETAEIPFDLIERKIIEEASKQAAIEKTDEIPPIKIAPAKRDIHRVDPEEEYEQEDPYAGKGSGEVYYGEDYSDEGYPDEEYSEEGYSDEEYSEEGYSDEEYSDEYYEDDDYEDGSGGFFSNKFITIASILLAMIIVIIASFLFFRDRGFGKNKGSDTVTETEQEETEEFTEEEQEPETVITKVTVIDDVNVRDNPDKENSTVLQVAKKGEQFDFLGFAEGDNWVMIRLEDGTTAYVFAKFVEITDLSE